MDRKRERKIYTKKSVKKQDYNKNNRNACVRVKNANVRFKIKLNIVLVIVSHYCQHGS